MKQHIGLIDVDGHNYPNLPLMKLSAWHKQKGDFVEWYNPLKHGHPFDPLDKVYMSKVFSFTDDYPYFVNANEVIKGGSGYCISLVGGKEVYNKEADYNLSDEVEHIYPDYTLYNITDTAYGFMSRGCPRGCDFCHVKAKEGIVSHKVADLSEFWNGQKNIVLCDPNTLACKDWRNILQQLIDSGASVNFNQGLDIRLMTEEKAEMLSRVKLKNVHFAWDNYQDKERIVPKFEMFKKITNIDIRKTGVYVLTNFNTSIEQDLDRIYTLRDIGYFPDVRIYNKMDFVQVDKNGKPTRLKPKHELLMKYDADQIEHFRIVWKMQRWVNMRRMFMSVPRFEEYLNGKQNDGE